MTQVQEAEVEASGPSVTAAQLFVAFSIVGVSGFGGVLPFAHRMLVEQRRWLTQAEFLDLLSLCQFLPGPNIVNLAICVGTRFRGILGAAACVLGLLLLPMAIIICLGWVYVRYGDIPQVRDAFRGVSASAAGLIVAMGLRMAWPMRKVPYAIFFGALVILCIVYFELSIAYVIPAIAPFSIAWVWWVR